MARETVDHGIQFLLQAVAECGNIDVIQIGPTVQRTSHGMHNMLPGNDQLADILDSGVGRRMIYRSSHNEEGSRFWRRSNENVVAILVDQSVVKINPNTHCWASWG